MVWRKHAPRRWVAQVVYQPFGACQIVPADSSTIAIRMDDSAHLAGFVAVVDMWRSGKFTPTQPAHAALGGENVAVLPCAETVLSQCLFARRFHRCQ